MYTASDKDVANEIWHSNPKENVITLLLVVIYRCRSHLAQDKERLPLVAFPRKPYSTGFLRSYGNTHKHYNERRKSCLE